MKNSCPAASIGPKKTQRFAFTAFFCVGILCYQRSARVYVLLWENPWPVIFAIVKHFATKFLKLDRGNPVQTRIALLEQIPSAHQSILHSSVREAVHFSSCFGNQARSTTRIRGARQSSCASRRRRCRTYVQLRLGLLPQDLESRVLCIDRVCEPMPKRQTYRVKKNVSTICLGI